MSPNPKKRLLMVGAVCFVALALIVVGVALLHKSSNKASATTAQAVVEVGPDGFIPATLHVKAGTTVTWKNTDSSAHHVASDPYPSDSDVPGLNSHVLTPGGSYSFTFTDAKTVTYHDEVTLTNQGTIVVEK